MVKLHWGWKNLQTTEKPPFECVNLHSAQYTSKFRSTYTYYEHVTKF